MDFEYVEDESKEEPIKRTKEISKKKSSSGQEKIEKDIDQSLNGIVNKRIMKLVKIGLKHELTIDNIFQYFREVNKTKLYELKRYFSDAKLSDIDDMLQYLYKTGVLTRDKNNWYSLK